MQCRLLNVFQIKLWFVSAFVSWSDHPYNFEQDPEPNFMISPTFLLIGEPDGSIDDTHIRTFTLRFFFPLLRSLLAVLIFRYFILFQWKGNNFKLEKFPFSPRYSSINTAHFSPLHIHKSQDWANSITPEDQIVTYTALVFYQSCPGSVLTLNGSCQFFGTFFFIL